MFMLNHLFLITLNQIRLLLQINQLDCCLINLLIKLESLILHFDSFSLRESKITLLERRAGAFVTLARVLIYTVSKVTGDALFTETHCQIL